MINSKYLNMNKLFLIVAVIAVVAICFSSCKSHERCPAYNKTHKTQKVI